MNEVEALKKQLEELELEIADSNKLLDEIPACPIHGKRCISHAIKWVSGAKTILQTIVPLAD